MAFELTSVFGFVDLSTVLVASAAVLLYVLYRTSKLPENFPPGPRPWPLIGTLPFSVKHEADLAIETMKATHGPVMGLKMGSYPTIVITGYDAIKEALVDKAEDFSIRPEFLYLIRKLNSKGNSELRGIANRSGEPWKRIRRFALMAMRDLGVGKNSIEEKIVDEAQELCKEILQNENQPLDVSNVSRMAVSNIICGVCFNRRFAYDDPKFHKVLDQMQYVFKSPLFKSVVNYIPLLQYFPLSAWIKKVSHHMDDIDVFIDEQVAAHKEDFDENNIRDFVDLYLKNEKETENGKPTFHRFDLQRSIVDLFAAGTDTTSLSIQWFLLYMIHFPDVQTKCQQEIDSVLGDHRLPRNADRKELPYVDATIHEVQRVASVAPFSLPHATDRDTTLCNYRIPKNTLVMANLHSALMDPKYWKEPEQFRPERWIGENGKFSKNQAFVPFSMGPRVCLGESLAKMEMFIFVTSLLQRFRFHMADPGNPPTLEGEQGITYAPLPFQVVAKQR